jgi:hypothetical protein
MTRNAALYATLAAVLAPLASPTPGHAQSTQDFRWSGRVAAGQTLEIKGINGAILAEAASGPDVEVVAHKSGRRSDPTEVTIEVIPHAGGVTVCALYPSVSGQEANRCAPGSEGRMNTQNNDVQVEFSVRVPAGVRLTARSVGFQHQRDAKPGLGAGRSPAQRVARDGPRGKRTDPGDG